VPVALGMGTAEDAKRLVVAREFTKLAQPARESE